MDDRVLSYRKETISSLNKKKPKGSPELSPNRQGPRASITHNTTSDLVDTSTQFKESYNKPLQGFPETDGSCLVPNDQVDFFRRVTREYRRAIRHIPIALEVPRRKRSEQATIPIDEEHSYVPSVDDLILDMLQEIQVPFDRIPESPRGKALADFVINNLELFIETGEIFGQQFDEQLLLLEVTANINRQATPDQEVNNNMAGHIPIGNVPIGNQPPPPPPRWRAGNIIVVPGQTHDLPRHLEKYITKFDLDRKNSAKEHLLRYKMKLETLQVEHEDVTCKLFSYSLEGKASSWFCNLAFGSITRWDQLERMFITKYGIKKTPSAIVRELSTIKMNHKETINDFNQRFAALLNKLPAASRPAAEILCGFYLSALPTTPSVFMMNKDLHTLEENFEATEKFEQDMISLGKSINVEDNKPNGTQDKRNAPHKQTTLAAKGKETHDQSGYQKTFQKISNELIDLKKMFARNP